MSKKSTLIVICRWFKKYSQRIMTLKFSLLFDWLNFLSFSLEKQVKVIEKSGLTITKVVEVFEYKKTIMSIKTDLNCINKL